MKLTLSKAKREAGDTSGSPEPGSSPSTDLLRKPVNPHLGCPFIFLKSQLLNVDQNTG